MNQSTAKRTQDVRESDRGDTRRRAVGATSPPLQPRVGGGDDSRPRTVVRVVRTATPTTTERVVDRSQRSERLDTVERGDRVERGERSERETQEILLRIKQEENKARELENEKLRLENKHMELRLQLARLQDAGYRRPENPQPLQQPVDQPSGSRLPQNQLGAEENPWLKLSSTDMEAVKVHFKFS